jgi:hypothetical protein
MEDGGRRTEDGGRGTEDEGDHWAMGQRGNGATGQWGNGAGGNREIEELDPVASLPSGPRCRVAPLPNFLIA